MLEKSEPAIPTETKRPNSFVIATGAKRSGEICCSRTSIATSHRVPHPERSEGWARRSGLARRAVIALLLSGIVLFGAHASDTTNGARYQTLSHKIMCPCGCNELLGECNHVGCPDSDKMRSQLAASIDHGDEDTTIFHAFQDEYGPTALAAPMFTRLNQFSWWVPPIVLLLGIGGVFFVVRRWRPHAVAMPTPASDPNTLVLEQRIRMETGGNLGRETGGDSL